MAFFNGENYMRQFSNNQTHVRASKKIRILIKEFQTTSQTAVSDLEGVRATSGEVAWNDDSTQCN
jgi:hypothetical protein